MPHFFAQQLLDNPQFLEQLLDNAPDTHNTDAVRVLLPIYQQSKYQDEILLMYVQSTLANTDQQHKQAIELYRQITAKRPELTPMRFQLAFLLSADKQCEAAKHQLDKIHRERDLPDHVAQQIHQAHQRIKQQQRWSVQTRLRYLHDKTSTKPPPHKRRAGHRHNHKQRKGWLIIFC